MDVLDRADLPFPHSLPEFQRLFPDDAACAAYLEKARWGDGFACLSRMTALTMVFKPCQSAAKKWRRLDGSHQIAGIIQGVKFKDGEKLTERSRLKPASPTFDNSSRQDLAGAARMLCNFHACGPPPGIDPGVCRRSGLDLRDVFPTGCVEGRAEGAARSPGRSLRRWAELDRSRPQPVVDGVERFDQLVIPWILRIE